MCSHCLCVLRRSSCNFYVRRHKSKEPYKQKRFSGNIHFSGHPTSLLLSDDSWPIHERSLKWYKKTVIWGFLIQIPRIPKPNKGVRLGAYFFSSKIFGVPFRRVFFSDNWPPHCRATEWRKLASHHTQTRKVMGSIPSLTLSFPKSFTSVHINIDIAGWTARNLKLTA